MNIEINFPALVIGKSSIDKINYKYLVSDKRYISQAYKDVKIVDSSGNCFNVERVKKIGGINLFYSLKLLGLMVRVEPVLKESAYKISVEGLKKILIDLIEKYPQKFTALSDSRSLIGDVQKSETYSRIMNLF